MRVSRGPSLALRLLPALLALLVALAPLGRSAAAPLGPEDAVQAYRILEASYVDAVDSRVVLGKGWAQARDAVVKAGGSVPDSLAPSFAGDADTNVALFKDALGRLIDAAAPKASAEEVVLAAIGGIGRSVNDDHTAFLRPAAWKLLKDGENVSLGYYSTPTAKGSLVWDVAATGPAADAGVSPGDLVVAVNGTSLLPGSITRPDPPATGVTVDLDVMRPEVGETHIQLTPQTRKVSFFATKMLDGDIAYVRLYSFLVFKSPDDVKAATDDLSSAIGVLEGQSPRGWILDLRNDSGGSIAAAQFVASRFGLTGVMNVAKRGTGSTTYAHVSTDRQITGPLAILINKVSASASEVVAAALHDERGAYLVGEKTAGHINESRYYEVAGGALQVTTARAYAGKNERYLDGVGVEPDKLVTLDSAALAAGSDAQIEAAVAYLMDASR